MKITSEQLRTFSSANHPEGERITRIMAAALNAVDPLEAIGSHIHKGENALVVGDRVYSLNDYKRILVIGTGKASVPMATAVCQTLGDSITSGLVITKKGYYQTDPGLSPVIQIIEAGHPLPDQAGIAGTRKLIQLLGTARSDDLILCLISGGGSALMTAPKTGITIEDIQILTSLLLACGATIDEVNTVRKHIDQVKGGGLLDLANAAQWITLILSDVIDDPLDRIASGPTAPDPSTYEDAYNVLRKYELLDRAPETIISCLIQGKNNQLPETPKPGNPIFERVYNLIIGNNSLAAEAAIREAANLGFRTLLLTTSLQGEARQAGMFLASIAQQIARSNHPLPRPVCIVAGGETTVTLHGKGLGGRNQELVLGAVNSLHGLENIFLISLATDGGDGPTDAAGAVATGETFARALDLGIDPTDFLTRNDSYNFFRNLNDLLKPGPTLTNVGDLTFLFAL